MVTKLRAKVGVGDRGAWMTAAYREHGYTMAGNGGRRRASSSMSKIIKDQEGGANS